METPSYNTTDPTEKSRAKHTIKRIFLFIGDILFNAIVIIVVVVLIRFVLVSPFQVNGSSMEPTLHNNELLIVDKISYRFKEPQRGDMIIFAPPENTDIFFVKRIIALPGETIEFHNGQILIRNDNHQAGLTLDESYLSELNSKTFLPDRENDTFTVPENHYYVMGDNRNASNDSRLCFSSKGCVDGRRPFLHKANIEGRAWLVIWPFSDLEVVDRLEYNV